MSDDLAEIMSRDPLSLTKGGPEIKSLIAFYRSKRKDFLFPAPKEKAPRKRAIAEPVKQVSLNDLFGGK